MNPGWLLGETNALEIVGNSTYFFLAAVALWGLYCVFVVWNRVAQKRFRTEAEQNVFLDQLEPALRSGDFAGAQALCENDQRAVPQLTALAIANRGLGYQKVRSLVVERFQRDVLGDLEHRLTWISTVIKSAPMLGLFGTVAGMMGAFSKLASSANVETTQLAGDIDVALRTTACGLAIAIPLILMVSAVNIRIRKMEDLVSAGLTRVMDAFKEGLSREGRG
jgi:biopolymer transport protein ExbB/TolQ